MKDLATTINESCAASLKAIVMIEKEMNSAAEEYNKTVKEASVYFETEKEPKAEDIVELIINVPTFMTKYNLLRDSLRSEMERFKVLYVLSQATESPVKGDEELIQKSLNSFLPAYIYHQNVVVARNHDEIEAIFKNISSRHKDQKEVESGFAALKQMCELKKQRASQTKP